jgi:hypothetical protein
MIPADEEIKSIYTNVFLGQGKHGDFLRSFAGAVMRADRANFEVLRMPALDLISKYNLESYK